MSDRVRIGCVMLLLGVGAIVHAADGLRIVPVVHDDQVLVSVQLADGYTNDVRESISSGLRTTFTYDVALRMAVPVWVDRTIATAVVSISDRYDNLTRRHSLSRIIDGRVQEAMVTEDEAVVRHWLTTLDRLPLCGTSRLEPSREYYLLIKASVRPRHGSLLDFAGATTGRTKFTFIP